MAARGAERGAPEERLVNLVVALMATEQGLTKETILRSVAGYRDQREAGASKDALEKMFERDKENLRGLGIPIETIGDFTDPDDLREARYRVPRAEYALPEDIVFSPAEIALLTFAGGVWSQSSMSEDARSGLRKIRALGISVDAPIVGYSPRVSLREPAFRPLQSAIEQSRAVRFGYLKPGDPAPRLRNVQPLALVEYEARWHLFADDLDAAAERTFLLSRVVGEVELMRTRFAPARRDGAGERALAGLREVAARQSARLQVDPGTEAELRLGRRGIQEGRRLDVPFVDLHVLADELASYGPEVRVESPESLRDAVIARLRATEERNADARS